MTRALLLSLAMALAATPAVAGPDARPPDARPDATPETIAEARRIHDGATASYKLGKFEEALTGYSAAYQLYPAPAFLFNIAQCHFQLKQWERAEFFFGGYLREVPNAPNRGLVEDRIREARERRAMEDDAAQRKLDLEKIKLDMERAEQERQAREREQALIAERERAAERDRPVYKKWWFWTIVAGAAAGVATTVVLTSDTTEVLPEGSLGTWDRR
jgi:tetratricopeptide (TPR) repeat protein